MDYNTGETNGNSMQYFSHDYMNFIPELTQEVTDIDDFQQLENMKMPNLEEMNSGTFSISNTCALEGTDSFSELAEYTSVGRDNSQSYTQNTASNLNTISACLNGTGDVAEVEDQATKAISPSNKMGSTERGQSPTEEEIYERRKAQNRAAQRAFRERKEGKLKELSGKLEDAELARLKLEKQLNELKQKNLALDMQNQLLQKQQQQQQQQNFFSDSSIYSSNNSTSNTATSVADCKERESDNGNKLMFSSNDFFSFEKIPDATKVLAFKFPNTSKCDFIEGTIDWASHGGQNKTKEYSSRIGQSYEHEEEKVLTISAVWDYLVEFTDLNPEYTLDIPGIMVELRGKEICHGFGPAYPIQSINKIILNHVENDE